VDPVEIIRSLYGYNQWANDRLIARVGDVPRDRLSESFGGNFDTIQGTLAHILHGEMFYFSRWNGTSSPTRAAEPPSVEETLARWKTHQATLDSAVAAMTAEQADATINYTRGGADRSSPAWQMMLNLVSHSTQHRAELADMLTRAGYPALPIDLADYYQDH